MRENGTKNKLLISRGKFLGQKAVFSMKSENTLDVSFNLTDYSINNNVVYAEPARQGLDSPPVQFTQDRARTLNLELLFDTYSNEGKKEDVRNVYHNKIKRLTELDRELHQQPPCKITGRTLEFIGVVVALKTSYLLFAKDGTPLRARVSLAFKEHISVDV